MNTIKKFLFSAESKRIIKFIIYFIFLCYSIHLIANAQQMSVKIIFAIITVLFLGFALWADYLELLSQNAIKALNYECDPEKALAILSQLEQKDFLNHYKKNSNALLRTLIHLVEFESDAVIEQVKTHDKLFRSSIDMLLVRHTTIFLAHVYGNNKTQAKKIYPEIVKLRNTKIKGKKIAPVYSWEELEALYHFVSNDYKKSIKAYQHVNTSYMNNKEKAQVYYFNALALINNHQNEEAKQMLSQCIEISNKLKFKEKAQEYLK